MRLTRFFYTYTILHMSLLHKSGPKNRIYKGDRLFWQFLSFNKVLYISSIHECKMFSLIKFHAFDVVNNFDYIAVF